MVTYIDQSWALADIKHYDQSTHPVSYKSGQISGRQKQVQPVAGVWNGVCRLQKHSKISVETFIGYVFIDWMIIRWPTKIIGKNLLFLEVYECNISSHHEYAFLAYFIVGEIFPIYHFFLLVTNCFYPNMYWNAPAFVAKLGIDPKRKLLCLH